MTSGAIGSHTQRSAISAMMTAAALQPCAKLGGSLLQVTTPQSAYNDQRQALPYDVGRASLKKVNISDFSTSVTNAALETQCCNPLPI